MPIIHTQKKEKKMSKYINEYVVRLKHDKGFINLRIAADTTEKAIKLIMKIEKAPFSAIRSVKLVK